MAESARCRQPLLKGFKKYGIVAYPIESGGTLRGMSDIFVNLGGIAVWIECKEVDVATCLKIPFQPLQKHFLEENYSEGGISIVAIRTPDAFVFTHISNVNHAYNIIENRQTLTLNVLDIPVLIKWLQTFRPTNS